MLPVLFARRGETAGWPWGTDGLARWSRDFDDFFGNACATPVPSFAVDVRQDGEDLVMEAEIPGLSQKDIEITVENGILTIAGETNSNTDEKKGAYHLRERRWGKFSRSFRLPESADGDKVSAALKDGVLTLRIPTREEAKPRRITVQ